MFKKKFKILSLLAAIPLSLSAVSCVNKIVDVPIIKTVETKEDNEISKPKEDNTNNLENENKNSSSQNQGNVNNTNREANNLPNETNNKNETNESKIETFKSLYSFVSKKFENYNEKQNLDSFYNSLDSFDFSNIETLDANIALLKNYENKFKLKKAEIENKKQTFLNLENQIKVSEVTYNFSNEINEIKNSLNQDLDALSYEKADELNSKLEQANIILNLANENIKSFKTIKTELNSLKNDVILKVNVEDSELNFDSLINEVQQSNFDSEKLEVLNKKIEALKAKKVELDNSINTLKEDISIKLQEYKQLSNKNDLESEFNSLNQNNLNDLKSFNNKLDSELNKEKQKDSENNRVLSADEIEHFYAQNPSLKSYSDSDISEDVKLNSNKDYFLNILSRSFILNWIFQDNRTTGGTAWLLDYAKLDKEHYKLFLATNYHVAVDLYTDQDSQRYLQTERLNNPIKYFSIGVDTVNTSSEEIKKDKKSMKI
ncbi:DUF31 family putative serine protease [Mycoplasma struthionis]|uniref:DUF31 domain-containing protein n=1 Tax=Mycoplasma struthionis TaxID=538220 RepID=A0A502M466_9MOLU|nr:hypothetical protein [Mycoplasma struthionis]TPI02407.1 hypothetical protein FJM01_00995 [Mycoplasma struthionis]